MEGNIDIYDKKPITPIKICKCSEFSYTNKLSSCMSCHKMMCTSCHMLLSVYSSFINEERIKENLC